MTHRIGWRPSTEKRSDVRLTAVLADNIDMPLSDEFLKQLGRVTANFATLEFYLAFAVTGLIGPEQAIGQMITSEMSFKAKLALLNSLLKFKLSAQHKPVAGCEAELIDLVRVITNIEGKRNHYMHSAWVLADGQDPDKPTRLKITAKQKKGLHQYSEDVGAEDLQAFADEIRAAAEKMTPLLLRCFPNAAPSG
jgi:hypothetical protein